MILWRSKPTTETEITFADMGHRQWRRVLEVTQHYLSFHTEVRSERRRDWWCGEYHLTFSWHFRWVCGADHFYYDGPHCAFSFGWVTLAWQNWECKRCRP